MVTGTVARKARRRATYSAIQKLALSGASALPLWCNTQMAREATERMHA
jgi:hypothetical protein